MTAAVRVAQGDVELGSLAVAHPVVVRWNQRGSGSDSEQAMRKTMKCLIYKVWCSPDSSMAVGLSQQMIPYHCYL